MSWKSSKGTCDSLSSPVPTRDNCLMYLFPLRSGGPYPGRWQGQWFLFMWAAASMLILNTGGERDSQQEGGRTRRWHEQLGRLMASLSPFPQCVSLGAEMEEPLCWGQQNTQHSVCPAALLINETKTTQKTGSASGGEFTGISFFNDFDKAVPTSHQVWSGITCG